VVLEVLTADALRDVYFVSDEGEDQTTSTTWSQKVRLTVVAPSGTAYDHLIMCYVENRIDNNENGIDLRLQKDDTDTLGEVVDYQPGNANGWGSMMLFDEQTLTPGIHHFDLDYRANTRNKNVRIRRARIWTLKYQRVVP